MPPHTTPILLLAREQLLHKRTASTITGCSCSYQWTFFIKKGLQTFPFGDLEKSSSPARSALYQAREECGVFLATFRRGWSRVAEIRNGRKLRPISPMCSSLSLSPPLSKMAISVRLFETKICQMVILPFRRQFSSSAKFRGLGGYCWLGERMREGSQIS